MATFIASQLEPNEWYLRIESELIAESIQNHIAAGARYIDLEGANMPSMMRHPNPEHPTDVQVFVRTPPRLLTVPKIVDRRYQVS